MTKLTVFFLVVRDRIRVGVIGLGLGLGLGLGSGDRYGRRRGGHGPHKTGQNRTE